ASLVTAATGCNAATASSPPKNVVAAVCPPATTAPAATAATVARPRTGAAGGAGRRCTPGTSTTRRGVVRPGSSAWAPLGERWRAKTCPSRLTGVPRPAGRLGLGRTRATFGGTPPHRRDRLVTRTGGR